MNWTERLKTWVVPQPAAPAAPPLAAGIYHYQRERDGGYLRFHLRVEPSGEALLIAGAAEAVRLSPAGAVAAKRLLDGQTARQIAAALPAADPADVVDRVRAVIDELGSPSARFPVFNLADPLDDQRDARLMAPFQADVVATSSETLHAILDRLWQAGVPHARLLHGDTVAAEVLVQAVEHGQDLGMIVGVRAAARWLAEGRRLAELAEVGLDYVVTSWGVVPAWHAAWFGDDDLAQLAAVIEQVRHREMTPVLEIALVAPSADALDERLVELLAWRVEHAEVFALVDSGDSAVAGDAESDEAPRPLSPGALRQLAAWVEETADSNPLQLVWLPPVACADETDVAAAARRGPRCGGDVSMRVQANGDVIPPRGRWHIAGNLLRDSWDAIWGGQAFRRFRQRVEANTRCPQCPGLAICAADCPAEPAGWTSDEPLDERADA